MRLTQMLAGFCLARSAHGFGSAARTAARPRCAPLSAEGGRASAAVKQKKSDQSEKLDLAPPRGTRDFYPEELRVRNWLFGQWRKTAAAHGFEVRAPRGL